MHCNTSVACETDIVLHSLNDVTRIPNQNIKYQ